MSRGGERGFTLLEVLVALVIVALGMSALLTALNQSATNVSSLRERTVAEWIAMNQIALTRLTFNLPAIGTTHGEVNDCADSDWEWQQQVAAVSAVPGLLSITVRVRRTGRSDAKESGDTADSGDAASSATAAGSNSGATPRLGAHIALGPNAPLGTIRTLSTGGCASAVTPGNTLGSGSLASTPGSLGADSLAGPSLAGPGLGGPGPAGAEATGSGLSGATNPGAGGTGAGPGSSSDASDKDSGALVKIDSGGKDQHWLVTLVGFRGNSLGAASGEDLPWAGKYLGASQDSSGDGIGNPASATPGPGTLTPKPLTLGSGAP